MRKKNYILIFVFFLIIFILTPRSGDDWGNYINAGGSLIDYIKTSYNMYFTIEGRLVSRFLILLLTKYKILWDILSSLLLTLYIKLCNNKLKSNFKYLPLILILLLSTSTIGQAFLWMAGSITYLYPTILVIYFILTIEDKSKIKYIIALIIPMFVENIGCGFVFGLIVYNIYYYIVNKKINKRTFIYLITAIISLFIMLISPGSQVRLNTNNTAFSNLSLFNKLLTNIPNLIKFVFLKNPIIIFLITFVCDLYLIKKKKSYRIITLFNIIPILCIIQNLWELFPLNIPFNLNYIDFNSIVFLPFFIFITYLYIKAVIYYNEDDIVIKITLLLTGIISVGVMLLVPEWGERVLILFYLNIIYLSCDIFNKAIYIKKNYAKYIIILLMFYYISISCFTGLFDYRRSCYLNNNKNINLNIYVNPFKLLWNYNPYGNEGYHIKTFKSYYNLNSDSKFNLYFPKGKELINFLFKGIVK